ncbi:hypothetical protein [Streptomyces sp. WMMC1477]|uniref:hypothetical protein n=1 Tax=Streptomyces sp. WMMC1477 TaxID=3015155 RepID=UPI0022B6755E|nr:hypothetical protein [Streptomyces sp. WMMC1477]MCZ7430172.1 hypothetical protein [Streptomyces sp. WMMC1477]
MHGSPTLDQIASRAPRDRSLSPSGVSSALRGLSLPGYDYFMALVRILITYDTGKIAPREHPGLDTWRQCWQQLRRAQQDQKITRRAAPGPGPEEGSALAAQVLQTAVRRGEGIPMHPMAKDTQGVRGRRVLTRRNPAGHCARPEDSTTVGHP